jgi:hypothetical protein
VTGRGALTRVVAALALGACLAACGSSDLPAPSDVAQSYVYALAEGNYRGACAVLDKGTRDALVRATGSRGTCPRVFARCLPDQATHVNRDQAQLLFANVQITMEGPKAVARLSGTRVARATRQVTMINDHGIWKLTSYGQAISRCVLSSARDRRVRHHRGRRQTHEH